MECNIETSVMRAPIPALEKLNVPGSHLEHPLVWHTMILS